MMAIQANQVLGIIWIVWLMSWVAASFWSDRAQKRAPTLETWIYRAAMITGGILLAPWTGQLLEEKPIWDVNYVGVYVLAAACFPKLITAAYSPKLLVFRNTGSPEPRGLSRTVGALGDRIGGAIMPLVKRDFSCKNAVETWGGVTRWSLAASSGGVASASRSSVARGRGGVSRSGCSCFRRR